MGRIVTQSADLDISTMITRKLETSGMITHSNSNANTIMRGTWKMLLLVISFLIALISMFQVLSEPEVNDGWSVQVTFLCLLWFCTYFICSYAQFKTFYLLTSTYILALSIFHLGVTIPCSLGLIQNITWEPTGLLAKWLERAGWYTTLSLACIGIGVGLSFESVSKKNNGNPASLPDSEKLFSLVFWDGIGLLMASAVFFSMAIYTFGNLLNYSRVDFFRTSNDTRGFGLLMMVLPSAILLLMIGAKKNGKLFLLMLWRVVRF